MTASLPRQNQYMVADMEIQPRYFYFQNFANDNPSLASQ